MKITTKANHIENIEMLDVQNCSLYVDEASNIYIEDITIVWHIDIKSSSIGITSIDFSIESIKIEVWRDEVFTYFAHDYTDGTVDQEADGITITEKDFNVITNALSNKFESGVFTIDGVDIDFVNERIEIY